MGSSVNHVSFLRKANFTALLTVSLLSGCGGGGGAPSGLTPQVAPALATFAEIGVTAATVADGAATLYLMTGKSAILRLNLLLDSSTAATDLTVTEFGKGALAASQDPNGGWMLNIDASAMANGEAAPLQIRVTNSKLNKYAITTATLSFITPQTSTARLTSSGGVVGPADFQVQVLPNNSVKDFALTVRTAVRPDIGGTLIDISLDTDIGDATVSMRLPEATSTSNGSNARIRPQSAGRTALAATNASALLAEWSSTDPYVSPDGKRTNLGKTWLSFQDYLIGLADGPGSYRIASRYICVTSRITSGQSCFKDRVWLRRDTVAEVNSVVLPGYDIDAWTDFEPVLFVHGFTLSGLGGGSGTWKNFPLLSKATQIEIPSKKLVPFEFRWNTDSSFKLVGKDLADAIQKIENATGKRVNIVAHSFGGILVRVVLEKIALPTTGTIDDMIASVLTLGAPHSGIMLESGVSHGVSFPIGADFPLLSLCWQVSCYESGFNTSALTFQNPFEAARAGVSQESGEIVASIYRQVSTIPNIPIYIGIGLGASGDGGKYQNGDNLISYEGQRFFPTTDGGRRLTALCNPCTVSDAGAKVREFVLGINPATPVFPGGDVNFAREGGFGWRPNGYTHSTGIPQLDASLKDFFLPSDSTSQGIEPGPVARGCNASISADICEHAGYHAFVQLMSEVYAVPAIPVGISQGTASAPGTVLSSISGTLDWNAVTSATSYILVVDDVTASWQAFGDRVLSPPFSVTLASGTQYKWRVAACNRNGCSQYSRPLYFTTPSAVPRIIVQSVSCTSPVIATAMVCTITGSNLPPDIGMVATNCSPSPMAVVSGGTGDTRKFSCVPTAVGAPISITYSVPGYSGTLPSIDSLSVASGPPTTTSPILVVTGAYSTCLLTGANGVKCWGSNRYGQLGDGTKVDRLNPTNVQGLGTGVVSISAFGEITCAVTSLGGAKCWGFNEDGELGDGGGVSMSYPVDVQGLTSGVKAVSADSRHTCALTILGGVKCWGSNQWGELGIGFFTGVFPTPLDVVGLSSGIVAISTGGNQTCALTSGASAKCWGYNNFGQLGDGSTTDRAVPVDVLGLGSGVVAVSAGASATCALTSLGGVKCWGSNAFGGLGDGTTVDKSTPVDVLGLSTGVVAISAGAGSTCALKAGGSVKCWGDNSLGQLGDGSTVAKTTPVDVVGLDSGVVYLTGSGAAHRCVVLTSGAVKCWGFNNFGQLGDGTTITRTTPVNVVGL